MTQDTGTDRGDQAKRLAGAYIEAKNYQRARDVLQAALAEHPNDPSLLGEYARADYLLKDYQSAASSAYAALSVAPQDELATRIYALALDELGRLPEALAVSWRGVIAHPNEPLQHRVYARLLQSSGQLPSALVVVDEALRLNPNSVEGLVLRGSILHDLGRVPESSAAYRQALSLDPGNAEALNNLGVNRLRDNKFTHALRGFLGAAGSDPTLGDLARRNIGAVLGRMLQRVTLLAVVIGFSVACAGSPHDMNQSSLMLRVVTAIVTVVLVCFLVALLRPLPRRMLARILKDRWLVGVRVVHGLLAVAAGAWATLVGGPPWTIPVGVVLFVSGVVLIRVGLFTAR